MAIVDFQISQTGLVGVTPTPIYITTTNTLEEVLVPGFLNALSRQGVALSEKMVAFVVLESDTRTAKVSILEVSFSNGDWSLVQPEHPGNVILPTVSNNIARFSDTDGTLTSNPGTAFNRGDIEAGQSGIGGALVSYAPTALKGTFRFLAADHLNNVNTTITNAISAQNTVFTVPDAVANTANILIDSGPTNIISYQELLPLNSLIAFSDGTWVDARFSAGVWGWSKVAAATPVTFGIDCTAAIRVAAGKGFRLTSIDAIYQITTTNLLANSISLYAVSYVDSSPASSVSIPITPAVLSLTTSANPRVTNVAINTPVFANTAVNKFVAEITVDTTGGSEYAFYGLNLRFDRTIA